MGHSRRRRPRAGRAELAEPSDRRRDLPRGRRHRGNRSRPADGAGRSRRAGGARRAAGACGTVRSSAPRRTRRAGRSERAHGAGGPGRAARPLRARRARRAGRPRRARDARAAERDLELGLVARARILLAVELHGHTGGVRRQHEAVVLQGPVEPLLHELRQVHDEEAVPVPRRDRDPDQLVAPLAGRGRRGEGFLAPSAPHRVDVEHPAPDHAAHPEPQDGAGDVGAPRPGGEGRQVEPQVGTDDRRRGPLDQEGRGRSEVHGRRGRGGVGVVGETCHHGGGRRRQADERRQGERRARGAQGSPDQHSQRILLGNDARRVARRARRLPRSIGYPHRAWQPRCASRARPRAATRAALPGRGDLHYPLLGVGGSGRSSTEEGG